MPEPDIPINPSWLNKSTRQTEIPEGIKRAIAAYKRGYEENRRTEQAKADRMALVEATARLRRNGTVPRFLCRCLRPA